MSWFAEVVDSVSSAVDTVFTGVSSLWGAAPVNGNAAVPAGPGGGQAADVFGGQYDGGNPANAQTALGGVAEQARMQSARAALAGKLEVVGDEVAGPRASNQVSPEELERLAGMYSAINGGRTDIRFASPQGADPEALAQFQAKAMGESAA